jgi:hypothetical protein
VYYWKFQITNIKQITITEIQNPKREYDLEERTSNACFGHAQRRRLRRVLNIGIYDLFVIWCLLFEILSVVVCYVRFHQLMPVIWKLGNRNDDIIN